jgi:hypothetical protein
MSTDYRLLADIFATDLFDGRLQAFGVHEHHNKNTTEERRILTDDRNYLCVHINNYGLVCCLTRYASYGAAGKILNAIADAFDVVIVSEYEPQFWGFDTQEEWDAAWDAIAKEDDDRFHSEVLKFWNGEPHDISPGTIGMLKAQIAVKLVEEDPTLRLPTNKSKLHDAIEATYDRDHAVKVTLGPEDIEFVKMMATHEDDLPKA